MDIVETLLGEHGALYASGSADWFSRRQAARIGRIVLLLSITVVVLGVVLVRGV